MFQAGDKVFIEQTAQIDIGFLAWAYIKDHQEAVVKSPMAFTELPKHAILPAGEIVYAVEWPEEFAGGHTCQGTCANHRGQFVAGKHLTLKFEESREVCTVPNIDVPLRELEDRS